ncbi:MAG: hypothetical protein EAZ06_00155 [Cytophagales bacterium]|nr:MAG: hypothetical protein EAY69_04840 [Cytophagales bacterium]TAH31527.1 MAG: hypothetical protein EAZ06_00155 [Cytophagales bacterium]
MRFCYFFSLFFFIVSFNLSAQQDELREAIKNYEKEFQNAEKDSLRLEVLIKLANIYGEISLDSSLIFQEKAEKIARNAHEKELLLRILILSGNTYRIRDNVKKSLYYYEEAEKVMKRLPVTKRDAYTLYYLAGIYRNQGKIEIAEKHYISALEIVEAQKSAESNNLKYVILNGLIELYKNDEDFRKAEFYLKSLQKVVSGLDNTDLVALNKNEAYEYTKDIQNTIKSLENSKYRTITYSIFGIFVTILISYIFWLYQTKKRREQNNAVLAAKNSELEVERQKSDALLLNILPKEVADELKEFGKAKAKQYTRATVLFTDFKGFTNISSGLTPEKLIGELNDCFVMFDEIIQKYNIERIKTIGDAFMCVGGIPSVNNTNPIDAVLAGLEMQRAMKLRRKEKLEKNSDYWQCRLGINTGEVIAGVIGITKFAYDIWGDTVNVASRMEANGEVDMVNISENTYFLVKDFFVCLPRGKLVVKGKGEMEMFFVEGIKPDMSLREEGIEPNESFWRLVEERFFILQKY